MAELKKFTSITNRPRNTMNTLPNIIVRPASIIKRATTRRPHIMLGLHSVTTWRPPSTRTTPQGNTRKCTAKKGAGKDVFAHISAVERAASAGSMRGRQSNMKRCRIAAKHQRAIQRFGADRALIACIKWCEKEGGFGRPFILSHGRKKQHLA